MSNFRERLESLSQKRLMLLALDLHSQLEQLQEQKAEPIAIIGLGCRVPGGEGGPDLAGDVGVQFVGHHATYVVGLEYGVQLAHVVTVRRQS